MKKWFLTLTAAGLFTMPALAADAQMLKHTAIVINGEMQAERSVGHIFEENNIAMLPVRHYGGKRQCRTAPCTGCCGTGWSGNALEREYQNGVFYGQRLYPL